MKIWYSKETGLIVREINGSYVYNYYYEFDKVQENDIQKTRYNWLHNSRVKKKR